MGFIHLSRHLDNTIAMVPHILTLPYMTLTSIMSSNSRLYFIQENSGASVVKIEMRSENKWEKCP